MAKSRLKDRKAEAAEATAAAEEVVEEAEAPTSKEEDTMGFMARRYMDLKKQIKTLNDGVSSLKKALVERVMAEGSKDAKGSFHATGDGFQVDYTARTSISYVEEAEDILKSIGVWKEATTRVIDDAKIEALHELGKISDADLAKLLQKEINYALYVKDPSEKKK